MGLAVLGEGRKGGNNWVEPFRCVYSTCLDVMAVGDFILGKEF